MPRSTTRILPPSRIAALSLVALLIAALAYIRFAPDAGPVTVPAGAQAGDLILEPCTYSTEDGGLPADCGTLVVPENRADPGSRLIALPVTRIRARSGTPAEPIFRLEGGPGLTNMSFRAASRFAADHDVVLVGYRGVDGSTRLDCPEVAAALKRSEDYLGQASFAAYADAFRDCAARLQDRGVDLAGYTITQRVEDLDAARAGLGYERIDLLSESAGTRTALIYSWRHPERVHRSVMIGANPPGHFLWDPGVTDEQIARYAELCAQDRGCSSRTDDLAASLRRVGADVPDRWLGLRIETGNVRIAGFYGLVDASAEAEPLSSPLTLGSWLSAEDGDAAGLWFSSLAADLAFPEAFVWGDVASIGRVDFDAARAYFSSPRRRDSIADAANAFIWGEGRLADAWPAATADDAYRRMRRSTVETLVIGGSLDMATPPQVATRELMPFLPNGRQVVLDGFGHTTDFWTQQRDAGSHLITTFLATGAVDDSRYEPQRVDFSPEIGGAGLGKIVAGSFALLAAVALVTLILMPLRVRRRGRFGAKGGAVLRSVHAVVVGVGGWLAGALVVFFALPGVPLDDQVLAVAGVGIPVGLCVFWAWVHRDWSRETKGIGLAAAGAGALIGAWLGFHAASGLFALVTAVAGAVAGANLAVIAVDIRQARRSAVDGTGAEAGAFADASEPAAPTFLRTI